MNVGSVSSEVGVDDNDVVSQTISAAMPMFVIFIADNSHMCTSNFFTLETALHTSR